jgi:transposase-like protein
VEHNLSDWLKEQLVAASRALMPAIVKTFAEALMTAEADAIRGASYGTRSQERRNSGNGHRGTGVAHQSRHH